MAQTIIHQTDECLQIHGGLGVAGAAVLSDTLAVVGATTCSSTVTASGIVTLNSIKLVQTMGGTETTAWVGGNAPVLRAGQNFFVFTAGASTIRVPCWPSA